MGEKPAYRRASPEEIEERKAAIRKGIADNKTCAQIAEDLNIPSGRVYDLVKRMPDVEPRMSMSVNAILNRNGTKPGPLMDALKRQDPEVVTWIAKNTPEGSTVADFVVACALDAFYAETEAAE